MAESRLAAFLDLTDEQLEEMGLDESIIHEDSGNSGDMPYSLYFNVPEETPHSILNEKGWEAGERVEIPLGFFDDKESEEPSVSREIELEQALIAVIGAYKNAGGDTQQLMRDAQGLILGHSEYRIVEHPYVTLACHEIERAVNYKVILHSIESET